MDGYHVKCSRGFIEGYYPDELHIGYVTNGVHHPTWTGSHWIDLYKKHFGEEYLAHQSNPAYWEKIRNVPDKRSGTCAIITGRT